MQEETDAIEKNKIWELVEKSNEMGVQGEAQSRWFGIKKYSQITGERLCTIA